MNQQRYEAGAFDGKAYEPELDFKRLKTQYKRVWELMYDRKWRTLSEISQATGTPEASASALLRDFRKEKNGGHIVNRRRRGDPTQGLFEYQLQPSGLF
jgi:hypothetical protein